jgi:pimeloyl-ACP methyl ester carboxylesterase/tetratricopeptide (TPR) repeat protein
MANILEKPVPDIRQIQPDVPPALADLVHRLLIKDPELRPPSMRQVAAELEAIRSGKEIAPRPPVDQPAPAPGPLPARPFAPVDQQIRFATSADGTRIGYAVVGSGPPLVKVANPLTHLQYDWESPVWRHWVEELSRHHMLVRYDERGCGMSERKPAKFSVEAWVDDLEAVVDDLGLERFPIFGMSQGASIAVAYAVRHPDKVSRLILYGGYARGRFKRDLTPEERIETETLLNLIRVGWGKDLPTFRQIFATLFIPDGLPNQHEWFSDLARLTVDPEIAEIMERSFYNIDVTELAPQITVPTLVLHPRGDAMVPFAEGQLLAELIPEARFVPLESNNHLLLQDEPAWQQFLREAQRFVPPDPTGQEVWASKPAAVRRVHDTGKSPATFRTGSRQGVRSSPKHDQVEDVIQQIPFIGRESELKRLVSALDTSLAGSEQVVLVEGESGIGKSRLVEEVTHVAQERGVNVLSGKCYEAEQSMPYQLVIHLVAQVLDQWPPDLLRRVSPSYLAELARLVPEINNLFPDLPAPSDLKEAQQSQFFRALAHLLSTLAEGTGLMVVVDDIQWADRVSQQFLNYLILHPETDPLLLVANYRSGEVATNQELSSLVQRWQHESRVSHLHLGRFTADDANTLVEKYLEGSSQAASLSQWLYKETEGHPLFLVSILQSMAEQDLLSQTDSGGWSFEAETSTRRRLDVMLPDAVRQSVNSRLRHLPKAIKQVVELVAVCGRRFDFQMLQAITKQNQDELLEILEELVTRQLWREVDSGRYFDFSHDKIREVVYHDLSNIKRVVLHRQVAEAIERQSAGKRVGLLAEQYEKGEVWAKAVSYLSQAADKAAQLFAMAEACDFYDRAIKIIKENPDLVDGHSRLRLYERRGSARTMAGQLAEGIADLEEVLQAVRQANDQAWERTLLVELGHACRKADRLEQALQYLTEALDLARNEGDDRAMADILYHLGTTSFSAGAYYESAKYHQEAVDICTRLGYDDLVAVQAFHGRGEAYFTTGDSTAAIEYYQKSLRLARQIQDKSFESENLQMMGFASFGMAGIANYEQGLDVFSQSLAISQRLGLDWLNWASFAGWAYGLGCTGDYAQGLKKLEQHIAKLERVAIAPRYLSMTYDLYGDLLRELNLFAEAEAAHRRGLEVAAEVKVHFWHPRLKANLAIDRMRQGQLDVEGDLLEALTSIGISGAVYHEVRCLEGLAEFYLAAGNPQETREHGEYLLAAATPGAHRELIAQAHRWRGEALLAMDDYAAAESALQEALNLSRQITRPRLAWDIHDALARLCRITGNEPAAKTHEARIADIVGTLAQNLAGTKWPTGLPQ